MKIDIFLILLLANNNTGRVVKGELGIELDQIIFLDLSLIVRGLNAYKIKFIFVKFGSLHN